MAKYVSRRFVRPRKRKTSKISEMQAQCERIAQWRGHELEWEPLDASGMLKGECNNCGAWIRASLKDEPGKDPIWGPMQITFCNETVEKDDAKK